MKATIVHVLLPVLALAALATAGPLPCNTGVVDSSGTCGTALVPVGTADPHWQIGIPFPSLPSGPALTASQLMNLMFGPVYANTNDPAWIPNGPNSEWLTPSAMAGHAESGGQYVYQTTFTGLASIGGRFSSD